MRKYGHTLLAMLLLSASTGLVTSLQASGAVTSAGTPVSTAGSFTATLHVSPASVHQSARSPQSVQRSPAQHVQWPQSPPSTSTAAQQQPGSVTFPQSATPLPGVQQPRRQAPVQASGHRGTTSEQAGHQGSQSSKQVGLQVATARPQAGVNSFVPRYPQDRNQQASPQVTNGRPQAVVNSYSPHFNPQIRDQQVATSSQLSIAKPRAVVDSYSPHYSPQNGTEQVLTASQLANARPEPETMLSAPGLFSPVASYQPEPLQAAGRRVAHRPSYIRRPSGNQAANRRQFYTSSSRLAELSRPTVSPRPVSGPYSFYSGPHSGSTSYNQQSVHTKPQVMYFGRSMTSGGHSPPRPYRAHQVVTAHAQYPRPVRKIVTARAFYQPQSVREAMHARAEYSLEDEDDHDVMNDLDMYIPDDEEVAPPTTPAPETASSGGGMSSMMMPLMLLEVTLPAIGLLMTYFGTTRRRRRRRRDVTSGATSGSMDRYMETLRKAEVTHAPPRSRVQQ